MGARCVAYCVRARMQSALFHVGARRFGARDPRRSSQVQDRRELRKPTRHRVACFRKSESRSAAARRRRCGFVLGLRHAAAHSVPHVGKLRLAPNDDVDRRRRDPQCRRSLCEASARRRVARRRARAHGPPRGANHRRRAAPAHRLQPEPRVAGPELPGGDARRRSALHRSLQAQVGRERQGARSRRRPSHRQRRRWDGE
jgi:hypothetical protein